MPEGTGPKDEEERAEGQGGGPTTKGSSTLETRGGEGSRRSRPRKLSRVGQRIVVDGTGREYRRVTAATILIVVAFVVSAIALILVTYLKPFRDLFPGESYFWVLRVGLVVMITTLVIYVVLRERSNLRYVEGLLSKLTDVNRYLRLFMETGHEIGTTLELPRIMEAVLGQILAVTGADMGAIYLMDKKRDELRLSFVKGADREKMMFKEIKLGEGRLGVAATSREIVTMDNLAKVDEWDNVFLGAARPGSQVIMPLVAREKLIGVLTAATLGRHEFFEDEQELLKGIAELTSMAATSSELYRIATRSLEVLAGQMGFTESVLREMMAGVITADMNGRIAVFNKEAQRLTGFTFAEKSQAELRSESSLDENPLAPLESGMLEVLEVPSSIKEGEALIMKKDRAHVKVRYRVYPLADGDDVLGVAAVFIEAV
ncbi:MAG: GAF domain-containing protein [Actinobacteria bacterium]|nr:GAF domain-containing protein [Actinomycetota bacterium]